MFLNSLIERNPALLQTALELHQDGRIPPNTWVIDLDTIAENARILSAEARRLGLGTYLMTKQYARNPYVTRVALANGLYKTVAVDMPGALQMRRYDIPVGHMGHLEQIPRRHIEEAVAMRPDVITVYNIEHARWIDRAAAAQGVTQDLLIRVFAPDDLFFQGQEGGIAEAMVPETVRAIQQLSSARLVGVTAFPCVRYNRSPDEPAAELTLNFYTIVRAAQVMRDLGVEVTQINAPGNTSSLTMQTLAEAGATHVEPGHGLLGTSPNHAFLGGLPERPAYTWLSEISHTVGDLAYAYGGGLFQDIYQSGYEAQALVGSTWSAARENRVRYFSEIEQIIDYHAVLSPAARCRVGDTALFGFRTQMQMTRSYIAPISGLARGAPRLHLLFDTANTALDDRFNPVATTEVGREIDAVVAALAPGG